MFLIYNRMLSTQDIYNAIEHKQCKKRTITKEQRKIYTDRFIERIGGIDEYKKYMSEKVLNTYYNKKAQNADQPKKKLGRPSKNYDFSAIKQMRKDKNILKIDCLDNVNNVFSIEDYKIKQFDNILNKINELNNQINKLQEFLIIDKNKII